MKKSLKHWTDVLHGRGYMALFLGNHDQCRVLSRFGNTGEYRIRSAKTLANAVYFLEGIPYIYQGDELGMVNTDFEDIGEFDDVEVKNYWKEHVTEKGEDPEAVLKLLCERSRDAGRSPIPWSQEKNGGFTVGTPWLKVGSEFKTVNVQTEDGDPDSVLNFYRKLIRIRHGRPVITRGGTRWIEPESDEHMCYIRTLGNTCLASLNNFSDSEINISLPLGLDASGAYILLSNTGRQIATGSSVVLAPWECLTLEWT